MSPCWSFIKHVCLCMWSAAHCDTVWYVESYKQLALNSIYKINSPRAAAAHISLLPPSHPPRFLPLFLRCLSSCSFSNSPLQSALCSLLPVLHIPGSISPSPPPPACPFISRILLTWLGTLWWSMQWLVVQLGVALIWARGQPREIRG